MNPLNFPSIELCKKLTDAGFPMTQNKWFTYNEKEEIVPKTYVVVYTPEKPLRNFGQYVCPSIAELLDELPPEIFTRLPVFLSIDKCND